jgi:hypothetical protein
MMNVRISVLLKITAGHQARAGLAYKGLALVRFGSRALTTARGAASMLALMLASGLLGPMAALAQPDDSASGRDFPKTLTLDEPGIDDELSFPTFSRVPDAVDDGAASFTQADTAFEIDKRITTSLEVQLNGGYTVLSGRTVPDRHGWDDVQFTTKYVLLDRPQTETVFTVGLVHEFGRSGAVQAGASPDGATIPTLYLGQGMGSADVPDVLRALAVTGTLGFSVPDRAHDGAAEQAVPTLQPSASVQYSFRYVAAALARAGLPAETANLVAVSEFTYGLPIAHARDAAPRRGFAAPGLFYTGEGYQLAAEALLPLTRASGRGTGVIAQLNLSFARLGLGGIAGPLW